MDVVQALRDRTFELSDEASKDRFRAVLNHAEVGFGHVVRGRQDKNANAFTDAVLRANLAYEGTMREAYRILAKRDPHGKTTAQIEKYFESHKIFTDRVVQLLKNFRLEWRNPSTHEYWLEFRESEGMLALMSVSGFLFALFDQIEIAEGEALGASHQATKRDTGQIVYDEGDLAWTVGEIFTRLIPEIREMNLTGDGLESEARQIGFIRAAMLSMPFVVDVRVEVPIHDMSKSASVRADIVIIGEKESVVVEVKSVRRRLSAADYAQRQLVELVNFGNFSGGVLLFIKGDASDYARRRIAATQNDRSLHVVAPVEYLSKIIP